MSGSIEALTAALEENTNVAKQLLSLYTKQGGSTEVTSKVADDAGKATTAARKTTGKTKAPEKNAPKYTVDEVAAAAVKVKEELGTAAAQELIKEAGKADKLKEMKPENYDAFVEACELALTPEPASTETPGSDDL